MTKPIDATNEVCNYCLYERSEETEGYRCRLFASGLHYEPCDFIDSKQCQVKLRLKMR